MAITIQTGAHRYTNNKITSYSLMMGGLNVTHDALEQYDPLITGYGRIFMVRKPTMMTTLMGTEFNRFKHILEYGNTGVSGIGDVDVETASISGGYVGKSFEIPTVAKDNTNSFTINTFEFSGSPIRECIHSWINNTTDLESGLTHYGGLIANGQMVYSQANHTAEFIYAVTDRTGMQVEYACMFANCFPKNIKNDQFNTTQGQHEYVEYAVDFSTTKYEGYDVNVKATTLLRTYQILVNSLEFNTGLNLKGLQATGYDATDGKIKAQSSIDYRIKPNSQTQSNATKMNTIGLTTPSNSELGVLKANGEIN